MIDHCMPAVTQRKPTGLRIEISREAPDGARGTKSLTTKVNEQSILLGLLALCNLCLRRGFHNVGADAVFQALFPGVKDDPSTTEKIQLTINFS